MPYGFRVASTWVSGFFGDLDSDWLSDIWRNSVVLYTYSHIFKHIYLPPYFGKSTLAAHRSRSVVHRESFTFLSLESRSSFEIFFFIVGVFRIPSCPWFLWIASHQRNRVSLYLSIFVSVVRSGVSVSFSSTVTCFLPSIHKIHPISMSTVCIIHVDKIASSGRLTPQKNLVFVLWFPRPSLV